MPGASLKMKKGPCVPFIKKKHENSIISNMKCAYDKWTRNEVCNDCLDECLPNEEEKKKEKEKKSLRFSMANCIAP